MSTFSRELQCDLLDLLEEADRQPTLCELTEAAAMGIIVEDLDEHDWDQ